MLCPLRVAVLCYRLLCYFYCRLTKNFFLFVHLQLSTCCCLILSTTIYFSQWMVLFYPNLRAFFYYTNDLLISAAEFYIYTPKTNISSNYVEVHPWLQCVYQMHLFVTFNFLVLILIFYLCGALPSVCIIVPMPCAVLCCVGFLRPVFLFPRSHRLAIVSISTDM